MSARELWAAGLLPVLGLALIWAWSDYRSRQGAGWDVPIAGRDPRDLLRGHYVEYQYDWPGLGEDAAEDGPPAFLCLTGEAPVLERVEALRDEAAKARCPHYFVRAEAGSVYGLSSLDRGRLYLGQERASQVDRQLRDPELRAMIRIRQRPDGSFTPLAIRFRPLTLNERAEAAAAR